MSDLPPLRRSADVLQQPNRAKDKRNAPVSETVKEERLPEQQHWLPKEQAKLAQELENDVKQATRVPDATDKAVAIGVSGSTGGGVGWLLSGGNPLGAALGAAAGSLISTGIAWLATREGQLIDQNEARTVLADIARVAVPSGKDLKGKRYLEAADVDPAYVKPIVDILTEFLGGKFTRPDGTVVEFDLKLEARTEFENALKALR